VRNFLLLFSPGRILLAFSVLIVGYLLFSAGGNVVHSHRLAQNEEQLRSQVDGLHGQQKQLEQIRDYLRSDEYIEFMARRVFGLVQPGESLVVVQAPPAADQRLPADDPAAGGEWWRALFGR
jgi:cell division protein FtsB